MNKFFSTHRKSIVSQVYMAKRVMCICYICEKVEYLQCSDYRLKFDPYLCCTACRHIYSFDHVICEHCGCVFLRKPSGYKPKHDYCCSDCRSTKKWVTVPCAQCGKPLKRYRWFTENYKNLFCDKECAYLFLRGPNYGKLHGGRSSGRIVTLRKFILRRDEYKCRLCGAMPWDDRGRLEMHHIQPVEVRPDLMYDPKNCVLLCHKCHFSIHEPKTMDETFRLAYGFAAVDAISKAQPKDVVVHIFQEVL